MDLIGSFDSGSRYLRFALRALRRRPGFTSAAVLTLALGIGATTAIFSVVYSVLIKPLPYPNADELVRIRHQAVDTANLFATTSMYLTYRDENRTFASIGLWQDTSVTLTGGGEPERVRALRITDGTLQSLGVVPSHGRLFAEAEYGASAEGPSPVILSYAFWQRRFGGSEAAVGSQLSIDSPSGNGTLPLAQPSQVVGILPPDFEFLDMTLQPEVIVPVRIDPAMQILGIHSWQMLARLKPDVTLLEARADLERLSRLWFDAWPPMTGSTKERIAEARITPVVRTLQDDLVGGVAGMLWVLMGAIGAVLVIACANIGNLMLVRADERRPEFAARAALGAVPARIAKELLVESLVLGTAGTLVGLAIAYGGLQVLVTIGPPELPRLAEIALYPPVLAFTVAVSLVSTLVFGSITALEHALHIDMPMTGASRGSSASRARSTTRNTLVVVQVALALVLVVGAALMTRSFQALRDVDPGFTGPATVQTARVWIPASVFPGADRLVAAQHEMLDKIAALPGVTAAGFADTVPIESSGMGIGIAVDGHTGAADRVPNTHVKHVSPGYFEAMGTRMIAGRDVTWDDIDAGGHVAVISENFAREIASEPADALGKRVRLASYSQDAWHEVIGVVQSIHEDGLYEAAPAMVYWPAYTEIMFGIPMVASPSVTFAVRSERAGTAGLVEEIRQAVRSVSGSVPVGQERTMQDYYAGTLARTSFTMVMLAIAAAMALALGVIGIYGVIAYVVVQRSREIGIRSALGARPGDLERMFLLHGLRLSGLGAIVGLVASIAVGRLMSALLFDVESTDIAAYVAAIGVTVTAAALASYLPARRAAAISPIETLKAE